MPLSLLCKLIPALLPRKLFHFLTSFFHTDCSLYKFLPKCQPLFSYTPFPLVISSHLLSRGFPSNCTFLYTSAVHNFLFNPPARPLTPTYSALPLLYLTLHTYILNSLPPFLLHVPAQKLHLPIYGLASSCNTAQLWSQQHGTAKNSHPTVKLLARTIAVIYKHSEVHIQVAGGCEE